MESDYRKLVKIVSTIFITLVMFSQSFILEAKESNFNHDKTGFELSGPHERISCDSCHLRGIFKGTPKQCETCHDRGSQIASSLKPANHIQTSGSCEDCHAGNTWAVTGFDHDSITAACITCHNGTTTTGKTTNHVQSTNTCDDCHSQVSWIPARFDHSAITGSCASCHNGVTARGKSANHISSSNNCDNCHTTFSWQTNRVDHNDVVGGTCFTCHNGVVATGKHPSHITSGTVCDDCHITSAWIPANFDHAAITNACSSCHNGVTAVGPSAGHFITSLPCETCHRTNSFVPDIYRHDGGDHASDPICTKCHSGNNSNVSYKFGGFGTSCAACHMDDYKQDAHKKSEVPSPTVFYTVSDLQNCAGACHFYENGSIKESRTGEHSINQGEF